MRVLEQGRERGRVTIGEIAQVTGISRKTIKGRVSALTDKRYLNRHGARRGTWYTLS